MRLDCTCTFYIMLYIRIQWNLTYPDTSIPSLTYNWISWYCTVQKLNWFSNILLDNWLFQISEAPLYNVSIDSQFVAEEGEVKCVVKLCIFIFCVSKGRQFNIVIIPYIPCDKIIIWSLFVVNISIHVFYKCLNIYIRVKLNVIICLISINNKQGSFCKMILMYARFWNASEEFIVDIHTYKHTFIMKKAS